jgi:amidohydrolase
MPAAMTATPPCCWAPPSTSRRRATSTARCIFIFQPAEEGRGGAEAMVKDGLFEKFPCEQIFGMHNRPKLDVGKFAIRSGPQMAGGGLFDIHITGKGAHGARPETGIDPVIIATQIISALQSVVSRNVAPLDSAVISVTQMHAGDAYNVIPQEAVLRGTIRAFRKETMALVKERIETISRGIAQDAGRQRQGRRPHRLPAAGQRPRFGEASSPTSPRRSSARRT